MLECPQYKYIDAITTNLVWRTDDMHYEGFTDTKVRCNSLNRDDPEWIESIEWQYEADTHKEAGPIYYHPTSFFNYYMIEDDDA